MNRFSGKTALVSGAGGPMGAAVAYRLASEGANLVLTDISGRRLEENRAKLAAEFPLARIVASRASVLVEDEVDAVLAQSQEAGPIDVLVNVVGGVRGGLAVSLENMTAQRWSETFDLNLKGILLLTQRLAPGMRDRKYGRVVNFTSICYGGDPDMPEYGAAKAAVASLTRSIALEFAPHVTANCVAPGPIETSVLDRLDQQSVDNYLSRTPLKRFGKPEDIAAAVAFLGSDDASYVTGQVLTVAGGIWPAL